MTRTEERAIFGELSFDPDRPCTPAREDAIVRAWEHGKGAVQTSAYQACTLRKIAEDYSYCHVSGDKHKDPEEVLDLGENTFRHWLNISDDIVYGDNDFEVGCRPGGSPGLGSFLGGIHYHGEESFSFSKQHVDTAINRRQDDPHTINHLADTFWHEIGHNHGYRHGDDPTFCQVSGPMRYDDTMPYILGDCMKSGTFSNRVIAYAGNNQLSTTNRQVFGPGIYRASQGELASVGNNAITQFRVGPGVRITYCRDEVGTTGSDCGVFTNEGTTTRNPSLPNRFTNSISYLEVAPAAIGFSGKYLASGSDVRVFDLSPNDLRGDQITAQNPSWVYRDRGNTTPTFAPISSNRLNSMIVGDGLIIRHCNHSGGSTSSTYKCQTEPRNIFSYEGYIGDDRVSRIEVERAVAIYDTFDLYGSATHLPVGVFFENDLVSRGYKIRSSRSILVPPGLKARACDWNAMSNGGSGCRTFTNTVFRLDEQTLIDDISSIEVFPSCGDGVLDNGEVCDEGLTPLFGSCHHGCRALCGNGVVEEGESCDEGLQNGRLGACNNTCDGTVPFYLP